MHLWRKICYAHALIDACTLWGAVGILVSLPTLTMARCVLRKQSTFRIIANRSKWSSERNLGMQHVKCVSQSCQKQLNMFSKIGEKCGFFKNILEHIGIFGNLGIRPIFFWQFLPRKVGGTRLVLLPCLRKICNYWHLKMWRVSFFIRFSACRSLLDCICTPGSATWCWSGILGGTNEARAHLVIPPPRSVEFCVAACEAPMLPGTSRREL